jgi:cytoskeleton protein RodZ
MSGVVKDDPIPEAGSDKTVSAVGDAEAGHAEAPAAAPAEADAKHNRKGAPFLRVVTGDAASDFVAELPPHEQAPTPDVLPNQRIGSAIRSRRETLGYSLDQVAKDTRVHLSHLRAIEDMTPNLLGAPVYAKGYIRAYARYLGLDEMSTLERYLRECAILKDPEKHEIAPPQMGRNLPATVPVLGFLIVALIGGATAAFLMNGGGGGGKGPTTAAVDAQAAPSTNGSTAATAVDSVPTQQLRVVALRRSMLDVRSADGTKISHRDFEAGESFIIRVGAGWTVSALEDGSAFEWRLGDKSLGLMGETQSPMNSQSADLAATRTPIEAPVVMPPLTDAEKLNAAPGATPAPAGAAPSTTAAAPGVAGAPAPAKPKPRPKPVTPPTAEPEAAAPTAAAPAKPATPAQDPALAAYPNQPPPQ